MGRRTFRSSLKTICRRRRLREQAKLRTRPADQFGLGVAFLDYLDLVECEAWPDPGDPQTWRLALCFNIERSASEDLSDGKVRPLRP